MSFAFHRGPGDWLMSDIILKETAKAILADVTVDTTFDIPYVAGYSKDGKTFYIDCKLPRKWDGFDVVPGLILHESTERGLEGEINSLPYQLAHQVALRAERAYIEACGKTWKSYNAWCMKQISEIGSRKRYDNVPRDLDLEPYHDEEDWATLKKMFCCDGKPIWNGKKDHKDVD
jgi:hypothetical protein